MPAPPVPLSVLDLSPVAAGSSGAVSLRNSLDLARLADRLGYTRYWVAEHHNLPSIASSASASASAPAASCCRTTRRSWWPSASRCSRRSFPGASISGSAARRVRIRSLPMRCGGARMRVTTISWSAFRNFCYSRTTPFQKVTRSVPCAPCRRTSRCRRSGCSDRVATARSSPPWWARDFPSRIISPITTRSPRCSATATASSHRRLASGPTPFWPAPRFAPTARPRRNGSPPPSISTSCDAAAANTCRWRARRKPPLILIRRRSGD